ncbi:DNA-binding MarR family transcriptional regulator [Saccharopolyspora lacisalsi]|uniref:DNA-binding MarR family transcriptional regulator n=1 Tax=Halosaccharopolyspora lacisalsi TaxID=1000566 RepID=A0A839E5S3_9PSEU|nr:MarR family winged helix-turn-helix transcriptional regulator [Halosaccharopolyspora lacisalsi]MBA8827215.1 DNA-binding MarR family transcriptional regulator [Halosaccharopolyspora lacisalsi]
MNEERSPVEESHARFGIHFLLTQLGTHAASGFAERVGELGLTPPQVGMLRLIGVRPGLSQQALAEHLGLLPSKVVSFADDLERDGLLTRTRGTRDRRVYELALTDRGRARMDEIAEIATEHEATLTAALNDDERAQLGDFLRRIAAQQGITPGVHPGYRKIS